ncbi:MAG TPA: efflux RND transporter permease subunit [Bdellovibrionota bacterium]|jgi:hydrophobe/amphiphile efflux-1 (HAE1) family protein
MNLIDLSIRRPVFAWVLMFGLIVFGAVSLNRLGISQMPDVNFPVLNVSVNYEGAAPEVVESDLIENIEEELLAVEGIKEMRSTASQGSGNVSLTFDISRNIDVALQEVQTALSQMRMPNGVDPPVVRKQNPEEDPILYISVYGGKDLREMLDWTNNYLQDQISFLPGVGEVNTQGSSQRNLRIWLYPDKLKAHFLAISDVVDALRTQHLESAAGQFVQGARELRVRWLGEGTNPGEIADIQILRRSGGLIHDRVIRIKDVAVVEDGLSDVRRMARVDGKMAVNIAVKKQRGTNEVEVAKAVVKRLNEIKDRFPPGYSYRINVDFTKSTASTVALTIEKLWVAALITILVCFLFLGSIPAAINILFSIPTSIVGTFTILMFSGFTLNLFTLLALTLAISIVVDDAIMLLENIMRHHRMGKNADQASSDGAKEVLPAAIAATLAVIAVFLPVVFMSGIVGKYFFQFGITMSAAVLLSLLEAVTITPMRTAALLGSGESKVTNLEKKLDHLFEGYARSYRELLRKALKRSHMIVLVSLALFVLSLVVVRMIRQEFVPAQDQDLIIVMANPPPGSSLAAADAVAHQLEDIVKAEPMVDGFFVSVGSGGGGGGGPGGVFLPLALKPRAQRSESHTEIMDRLRAKFKDVKGARVVMRDISARNLTSGRQNPIAVNLRGPDLQVLNDKSSELISRLEKEGIAVDLDKDYRPGLSEVLVKPNRNAMAERKVSVESVGQALTAAVGGLRQGRYTADGRRYDIRFKLPDDLITSAKDIENLEVWNMAGNLVPLSQLVTVEERKAAQSVNRVNRQRAISVFGNIPRGQSQQKVLNRAEQIVKEILPPGYSYAFEGASAGFSEAFGGLFSAMMIGILVAYLILAAQFNSFIHPISVLIALPFSITGALLALWITGNSLNLFSFIGLIVLMGIAKKNSILLVEFTNQIRERKPGATIVDSLLEACPIRLRPVLMTSVATVAAALPLVLGHGMGHEARTPMGLSIIGGTLVSTALTLFVVPCLYLMLSRFESKTKHHLN